MPSAPPLETSASTPPARPVWAEVDLAAVRANVAALAGVAAPAGLLVAVKADAYGHGAVPVARAALEAGAVALGVASVEEGAALRAAGITATVLVFSEPVPAAAPAVVEHRLAPFVYTPEGVAALADAAGAAGGPPLTVHLKIDTGMHRVGCDPGAAVDLAMAVAARSELELAGLATHLSSADLDDDTASAEQLDAFDVVVEAIAERTGLRPPRHAANSAGVLAHPRARYDLVRVGIAAYGLAPSAGLADRVHLRPALSLHACVTLVKDLPAGAGVSYGGRYRLAGPARVATVPIGYGDGVPRDYGARGGEVLIGGRRHPVAGLVTMDQLMVDVGDAPVRAGDEVVLLGRQGDAEIDAHEWAARLDTITNEVVTRLGPRIPRRHVGG